MGRPSRLNPEGRQRGSSGVVAPALKADLGSGVGERGVPGVLSVAIEIADDRGAGPAWALRLPATRACAGRRPFAVRRSAVMLGEPIKDCRAHALPRPGALDCGLVDAAAGAALRAWIGHRSPAIWALSRPEVVVNARYRDRELRSDRPRSHAGGREPARGIDALSHGALEGQLTRGQEGGLERGAPGAEMSPHARAARPAWVLEHPFALCRGRLGRVFAAPILAARSAARLGHPRA